MFYICWLFGCILLVCLALYSNLRLLILIFFLYLLSLFRRYFLLIPFHYSILLSFRINDSIFFCLYCLSFHLMWCCCIWKQLNRPLTGQALCFGEARCWVKRVKGSQASVRERWLWQQAEIDKQVEGSIACSHAPALADGSPQETISLHLHILKYLHFFKL